jgi:quercetin dioxygenase-like cupin family protein
MSPPHRHGGASVAAVVIKGTAYNKMNNDSTKKMEQWENWYEAPGCHHRTSANASDTESMELIATFVLETKVFLEGGPQILVQVDEEYKDVILGVE